MKYEITSLEERPDLIKDFQVFTYLNWPRFMAGYKGENNDLINRSSLPVGALLNYFPEFQLILFDIQSESIIATGSTIPFVWDGKDESLPDDGWDGVMASGKLSYEAKDSVNALSALAVTVDYKHRGKGLSSIILDAMKNLAKISKLESFVVPLRPTLKHLYPLTPIEKSNDVGVPFDPWLRTHCGHGAKIISIANQSVTIKSSINDWTAWTGLKFPETGEYVFKDVLVTLNINIEDNYGIYVEPNIWLKHSLYK